MNDSDAIYAEQLGNIPPFAFDQAVAAVFPDMIARSAAGYTLSLPLIALWAAEYAQPDSRIYDLGCSLGATTVAMRQRVTQPCHFVAVDNSPAMVARCRALLDEQPTPAVELLQADVRDVPIDNASVVVLNLVLMFLPVADRLPLLKRIYHGLRPGGILIVAEKTKAADAATQARITTIHHAWKRANGYSDLEVSQKRTALENVLVPDSAETHITRLKQAGFDPIDQWQQTLNFVAMTAHKPR